MCGLHWQYSIIGNRRSDFEIRNGFRGSIRSGFPGIADKNQPESFRELCFG